jgi:hypothetical protein
MRRRTGRTARWKVLVRSRIRQRRPERTTGPTIRQDQTRRLAGPIRTRIAGLAQIASGCARCPTRRRKSTCRPEGVLARTGGQGTSTRRSRLGNRIPRAAEACKGLNSRLGDCEPSLGTPMTPNQTDERLMGGLERTTLFAIRVKQSRRAAESSGEVAHFAAKKVAARETRMAAPVNLVRWLRFDAAPQDAH